MKMALSVWERRISPVFDTSRQLIVIEIENGKTPGRRRETLLDELPLRKITQLREIGIEVLVCGAISKALADLIATSGITLIPFVAGEVEEVIRAFLAGGFPDPSFLMPGQGRILCIDQIHGLPVVSRVEEDREWGRAGGWAAAREEAASQGNPAPGREENVSARTAAIKNRT
jgi:predicted Fe-Mo cluster-binding NifX family protein